MEGLWKLFFVVGFVLLATSSKGEEFRVDEGDPSATVSINYQDGRYEVLKSLIDFGDPEKNIVARATFNNTLRNDGWSRLEIVTNEEAPDERQAIAAGIAEGYLTKKLIGEYYRQFFIEDKDLKHICDADPAACSWVDQKMRENADFVRGMVEANRGKDPYWHMVGLFYEQMEGLSKGYNINSLAARTAGQEVDGSVDITEHEIHKINFIPDFWDLLDFFGSTQGTNQTKRSASRPSCSVIIKHMPELEDIYLAHNTWHLYSAMSYRVLKRYNLNYHISAEGGSSQTVVPGATTTMSSYIGVILSLDDFLLTSAGLATTETSLSIYNKTLFADVDFSRVVFEGARVMAANRLATSGMEWAGWFKKENSGTYNNQWMVVDYNKLDESPRDLSDGVFTVAEQIPGDVAVVDETRRLREDGYWASYNRPAYEDHQEKVGGTEKVAEFGDWFTHEDTARAKIFRRDHGKIKDFSSLMTFMRYNDFENDPHAIVDGCEPERTPAGAIASRLDLSEPDSECAFSEYDYMVGHSGYGALDAKLASKDSFLPIQDLHCGDSEQCPGLDFTAVAGPTHERHPPFQWSKTNLGDVPNFRTIDKFDFKPIRSTWTLDAGSG